MYGSAMSYGLPVKSCNIAFQFFVRYITEIIRQRHDVLLTIAQWWNCYLEVVQVVQQILSETLFTDRLLQILVGGGDDTDIETLIRFVTHWAVSSFLNGTEQHLLGFHSKIAYLVQEQRAAFSFMEISFLGTVRSRESTFDVPEECRWRKLCGERTAVHRHEGFA